MVDVKDYLELGLKFHGHKCPAMPMGLRAGAAAMNVLGVERAPDKELTVISETGKGHAAGCFLDGIMVITSGTYGKSNIRKLYYNKMAFTLIDNKTGRSVRVSLKPGFFLSMVAPLAIAAFVGGQIGSRLSIKSDKTRLKKIFGFVLMAIAVKILIALTGS